MSTATMPARPLRLALRKGRNPCLSTLIAWGMERQGLSGNQLAHLAGINQAIVSRLVSGRRVCPSPETVEALAAVLKIKQSDLYAARRQSKALRDSGLSTAPDTGIR
jgi:transcriptional regulator with XRE-family HTH domain